MRSFLRAATVGLFLPLAVDPAGAETLSLPGFNTYGVTGAIDTPTAFSQPDGELATTVSAFSGLRRTTLSFQLLPRVQTAFRYSGYVGLNYEGFEDYYDRSFDLSLALLTEGRYRPALKLGFQDLAGTGVSSGEYIVASKRFANDRIGVSLGLGWGRLGSQDPLGTPFGDRPAIRVEEGGTFNADTFFRGPAAPFGSLSFQATDRLSLLAEYSSDAYALETGSRRSDGILERDSSFNYALRYRVNDALSFDASYLYGSTFGLRVTLQGNPYRPPQPGLVSPAPPLVAARPDPATAPDAWTKDWVNAPNVETVLIDAFAPAFETQGLDLTALDVLGPGRLRVTIRNNRYANSAMAVGRAARILTNAAPASVEFFEIVPTEDGLPLSRVTLRRSDLETLVTAPDRSDRLLALAGIESPPLRTTGTRNSAFFPKFDYAFGPALRRSYFDPEEPLKLQLGLSASASIEPRPGLVFSGSVYKPLFGDLGDPDHETDSLLPPVRTNQPLYQAGDQLRLDRLTAAQYFKPAPDLYGRITAGYLERMFAGVSTELLWKPVASPLAFGVEVNYARQRAFDGGFGLRDYSIATGHVSAYLDLPQDFALQIDAGRYLAGDVGATFTLSREFRNGWEVGAFATFTDASAEEFGEGSFDKGITFSIPVQWFTGTPSKRSVGTTIRPLTRDGGARLSVPGRLYDQVEEYHAGSLSDQWGLAWR